MAVDAKDLQLGRTFYGGGTVPSELLFRQPAAALGAQIAIPGSGALMAEVLGASISIPQLQRALEFTIAEPAAGEYDALAVVTALASDGAPSAQPTLERLESYSMLAEGWAEPGSGPIPALPLMRASRLIVAARERFGVWYGKRALPHQTAPIPGGGVQLEWRGASKELEIEIGPDGEIGFLLTERLDGRESSEEGDGLTPKRALELVGRTIGG